MLFATEHITKTIVTETNRHAEQVVAHSVVTSKCRRRRWIATTITKMKWFLGILFTIGLVKKACIEDYWSADLVIATPIFTLRCHETGLSYCCVFGILVIANLQLMAIVYPNGEKYAMLYLNDFKLCTFLEEIFTDESTNLWRGRLIFRQDISGKRHKYGVKLHAVGTYRICVE